VTVRQLWKASAWVPKLLLIALVLVGPHVFLVASDLLSADWIIWVGAGGVLGALAFLFTRLSKSGTTHGSSAGRHRSEKLTPRLSHASAADPGERSRPHRGKSEQSAMEYWVRLRRDVTAFGMHRLCG